MKSFIEHFWFIILITLAGLVGGFLYWRFIGCTSGSCPITSNWLASTFFGGMMGYLTGDLFRDLVKKKSTEK